MVFYFFLYDSGVFDLLFNEPNEPGVFTFLADFGVYIPDLVGVFGVFVDYSGVFSLIVTDFGVFGRDLFGVFIADLGVFGYLFADLGVF